MQCGCGKKFSPLTIEQHAKYLGVTFSSDGPTHKDIVTRLAKARKHFHALHQFWRNTDLTLKWKLRIYNAVFIPLVTYRLESAALTKGDYNRLEAHSSIPSESEQYRTELLFYSVFQYRGGTVGAGLRPGRRRVHWTEQCTKLLGHWLLNSSRPASHTHIYKLKEQL